MLAAFPLFEITCTFELRFDVVYPFLEAIFGHTKGYKITSVYQSEGFH